MSLSEKFSLPGAIVIAGALIAGAVLVSRAPARSIIPSTAPQPSAPPIEVRPIDSTTDHIRGNVNAPITLVEYSDTECPFCKGFHKTLVQTMKDYDGKVRWVYRHYPLDNLHSKARKEAEATECAGEQGKFWEYLDMIFAVTPANNGLDPAELPKIAAQVGLDVSAFETCLSSGKYAGRVQEDIDDALRAGGQGTPYTVILGPSDVTVPFSGAQPYERLRAILDRLSQEI